MTDNFIHFGLIVTGKGEHTFLPELFRSLSATGEVTFQVIRRIGQRAPITSPKKKLLMVGRGQVIPDEDQNEIGLPARFYLISAPHHCVLVIDDLEQAHRGTAAEKYKRYRLAIDTMLKSLPKLKQRASVHFLVNMLEAYYFADVTAINQHYFSSNPLEDYEGDVENIVHPKNQLKHYCSGLPGSNFDEVEDGQVILSSINIEHVLRHPNTCAWLRTLFAWNIEKIIQIHYGLDVSSENLALLAEVEPGFDHFVNAYHLLDGIYSEVSSQQLAYFGKSR